MIPEPRPNRSGAGARPGFPAVHVPRPAFRTPERGFTLVELVVVIFVIGLFSALVVPTLTGFGQDDLKLTARRLAGMTKYLYNEAALSGRPYRLVFDLDADIVGGRRLAENGELVAVDGTGADHQFPDDVHFRDVVVSGRGQTSQGKTWADILPVGWVDETVIHLAGSGDRALTLRLLPLTGTTEIYEGYREFQNLAEQGQALGR